MATKSAPMLSPLFFGLLLLVSIAFFFSKVSQGFCVGCTAYCTSLPLPVGYSVPNSGVKTGQCYSLYAPYPATPYLCLCCVA
ncbi:hypothetical protein MKW94_018338 [Papaver nudicaule]|uniref:Uncharacterized protein n=1 Tax=Papaver nudicaule TaxID=74823 RepID=A0AA41S7A8_PAPNU|nr:hypothetical protein [Papaver nudicaule]